MPLLSSTVPEIIGTACTVIEVIEELSNRIINEKTV
jgi:hypothetical protein